MNGPSYIRNVSRSLDNPGKQPIQIQKVDKPCPVFTITVPDFRRINQELTTTDRKNGNGTPNGFGVWGTHDFWLGFGIPPPQTEAARFFVFG